MYFLLHSLSRFLKFHILTFTYLITTPSQLLHHSKIYTIQSFTFYQKDADRSIIIGTKTSQTHTKLKQLSTIGYIYSTVWSDLFCLLTLCCYIGMFKPNLGPLQLAYYITGIANMSLKFRFFHIISGTCFMASAKEQSKFSFFVYLLIFLTFKAL